MVRRNDDNVSKRAMMLEVNGQQKRRRPKQPWRRQVKRSVKRIGLMVKKAINR